MTILGTDVSKWQGVVDFGAVAAAGVKFAVAKAVNGTSLDPSFKRNWAALKGKLTRGAYGWFLPDMDPIVQADALIAAMDGLDNDDMPPAVDFEQPTTMEAKRLHDAVVLYVRRLREKTGRKPLFYTGKWYWAQYVKDMDSPELVQTTDLWHAEYPSHGRTGIDYDAALKALGSPHPPSPWAKRGIPPKLWQFDGDKGLTLPGGQDADFNRFDGGDEEFAVWLASTVIDSSVSIVLTPPSFTTTREVQSMLIALGYDLGSSGADGDFGPKTRAAVTAFQNAEGLTPSGAVGPETRAALQAAWATKNA